MEQRGLTEAEAGRRLLEYGPNSIEEVKSFQPLVALIAQFKSPLIILLMVSATVSFFLGQRASAIIILIMVLVSSFLDFFNTFRSQKAVAELLVRVSIKAAVLRDGKLHQIVAKHLVPGDIILLSAGNKIPADCLILEANDLNVDQAALTGESFPVTKTAPVESGEAERSRTTDLKKSLSLERQDALFMGTSVVTGTATALVVQTGKLTHFGKIAGSLVTAPPPNDFEKGIASFSLLVARITVVMVAFVFIANTLLGRGALTSFIFAIAIAVGLTPELLPMIMTVSLSHGSILMARKNVIVKRLAAIQSFGSMTVLCTDKTGTLTEDKIKLIKYLDPFGAPDETVLHRAYLTSVYHTGVNNPLDAAITRFKKFSTEGVKKIREIPFDFQRKRSSIVVKMDGGQRLITKGAPEGMLAIATHYRKGQRLLHLTPKIKEKIKEQFIGLSNEGYRVLAIAEATLVAHSKTGVEEEKDLTILGLIAFLDPAKRDVDQVLKQLEAAGLEIKILTGDSEVLTRKIAADINLPVKGVLLGSQITAMSDPKLRQVVNDVTIFARITPDQKERIVRALKQDDMVVGYMGDGINDAPALRAADVGISVDSAVDIAKDTADIILLRKSLSVLHDGVIEGRKTFHNSLKYILMDLSSNFGNMFSMMVMSVISPFLPLLPVQVILNNLLYDLSQVTIPIDAVDDTNLTRPPKWDIGFIRRYMFTFGPVSSIFDFLTFGLLFYVFKLGEHGFQTGWFIESLTSQVLVIYIIRTRKIPFIQSTPTFWVFVSTLAVVAAGWLIPLTQLGHWFNFVPLDPKIYLIIAGLVLIYLGCVEATKRIFYHFQPKEI